MNDFEGNLIVLEGIDGCGTTTLADNLQEALGDGYTFTQEPSNGKYGRMVREELQNDSDPNLSDFYLFMADRYDHVQSLIGPQLEKGKNVVCDRYHLSTLAYQSGVIADENMNPWEYIPMVSDEWVITPDLTIYVDISVPEALGRIEAEEKYEKRNFLERARDKYEILYDTRPYIKRVDGSQSEAEVFSDSMDLIKSL